MDPKTLYVILLPELYQGADQPHYRYCLSTGSKDTSHFNAAEMSRIIKVS